MFHVGKVGISSPRNLNGKTIKGKICGFSLQPPDTPYGWIDDGDHVLNGFKCPHPFINQKYSKNISTEPTSTEWGIDVWVCELCGSVANFEQIPPLEQHVCPNCGHDQPIGKTVQNGKYNLKTGKCIKPLKIDIKCKHCGEVAEHLVYDTNLYDG